MRGPSTHEAAQRDCRLGLRSATSAIAGCRKRRVRCVGCSGDLLPPSPPAEKATSYRYEAWEASTDDRAGYGRRSYRRRHDKRADVTLWWTGIARECEHLGDFEGFRRGNTRQSIGVRSHKVTENILAGK